MSPTLHYCNTIYTVTPPSDLNPLIIQAYPEQSILVLCAKEQQVTRLAKSIKEQQLNNICHIGWWDAQIYGLLDLDGMIDRDFLNTFAHIVILDRVRIDEKYQPLVKEIELACDHYHA